MTSDLSQVVTVLRLDTSRACPAIAATDGHSTFFASIGEFRPRRPGARHALRKEYEVTRSEGRRLATHAWA
jgi:hypothetical protein